MNSEFDDHLTNDQWDTLRALRPAGLPVGRISSHVLQQLYALELVVLSDGAPRLTPKGRAVLLRGSPRLWDLAA